jgi:hypothetical protein
MSIYSDMTDEDSRMEVRPAFEPRDWSCKYNDTFVEVESRPPRWEDRFGNGGQVAPIHPWECVLGFVGDVNNIYVHSGRVIEDNVVKFEPPGAKFDLIFPATVVFIKFTYDAAGDLLNAEVDAKAFIPADTATTIHWIIAEAVIAKNSRKDAYVESFTQRLFEDVRLGEGGAGASGDHMWKVTSSGPAGGVSPNATYSVAGGVAVIQGTRVTVAAKPNLAASGGTGFVVLKVTRNSASRVYDPGNIPVIEFYTTVPPSTYAAEYTVLAETLAVTVPADPAPGPPTYRHDITQCRRDEICSYELLIVANGEFALLPVQANSRNSYAPPLP